MFHRGHLQHLYFAGCPVMTQTDRAGTGGALCGCRCLGGSMFAISISTCSARTDLLHMAWGLIFAWVPRACDDCEDNAY